MTPDISREAVDRTAAELCRANETGRSYAASQLLTLRKELDEAVGLLSIAEPTPQGAVLWGDWTRRARAFLSRHGGPMANETAPAMTGKATEAQIVAARAHLWDWVPLWRIEGALNAALALLPALPAAVSREAVEAAARSLWADNALSTNDRMVLDSVERALRKAVLGTVGVLVKKTLATIRNEKPAPQKDTG